MLQVDLNCDMGESFGRYRLGSDADLLNEMTSANIACGFHAGDPSVMRTTVRMAAGKGVSIGAHPGLPDLAGFGRRRMEVTSEEVYDMVTYQIGALQAFVKQEGAALRHVKPHGALYNMAAVERLLADAIAEAVYKTDASLVLYGLAGSELIAAGKARGLRTAAEVFADRTYLEDGTLMPRSMSGAVISDPEQAVKQVLQMVMKGTVTAASGKTIDITADTVCIHGDGEHALSFAQTLRAMLEKENVAVRSL
ncbi:5-oxoprolinase subunit PxpA [Paenibacillus sp.]|jgi:UPF0271 protein|uniref:LamB/YcsF family protein n=1 Tax=Paenibacillus sp. TaxID=58172 RepID=UPI002835204F|nr:5-oxoprolinase subunit PxpA [Paenibacillus sp.]MDR0271456.1 LamB/YcsF family protein [Paenibacillus sp.]